ncbi:hypothetical protein PHMEG_00018527 [Phytophthora megakarya]|uniref:Reverse transcriptase/retrotransposon-derived protein RNase H-like domain-containing protein n=1 Tax=Phytophthora megakarya TaxID=4795 RepID=A0A225VTU3_9STRA|nr:hypothetical protein PHMEG_00018527 [Phytophthora megakarya]
MRDMLIDFARISRQDALDATFSRASNRTKRVASEITVDLNAVENDAFQEMKNLLASSGTLAFPQEGSTTCLLTDASDIGWAVVVTQVTDWKPNTEVQNQQHDLLRRLTESQCHWSIIEKEAYPIISACEKLSYLLLRPSGFKLYCGHRYLVYVFTPRKEVKKHIRGNC